MPTEATHSAPYWTLRIDDDKVAWLSFDVPGSSANSLSKTAMLELNTQLDALQKSPPRALIVESAKKKRLCRRRRYQRVFGT